MPNEQKTQGEILKHFREKLEKISQEELSVKLDLSREIIGKMENDKATITAKTKRALLKEYKFDIDKNAYVTQDQQGDQRINMEMGLPEMFSMIVEIRAELSSQTSALAEILSKQTGEGATKFLEELQAVYSSKLRMLKTEMRERRIVN